MNPLEYLFGLEFHGHKFGLENIRVLTDALGRPQDAWPSVHVAGTNGKGSVCAMVSAGLVAAGLRTGCYTSPHLVRIEERYAVDGVPVAEDELSGVIEELRLLADRLEQAGSLRATPTFFEVATAAAFEIFRRRRVDIAVLEVGLGGRLDATNIASPGVGAITNIAFEHQQYLGNTLSAIASEKAGIVKPGMRIVCGERHPEAFAIIEEACRTRGASLATTWDGVSCRVYSEAGQTTLTARTPEAEYGPVRLALNGRHQVENALVAIRTLEAVRATGVPVTREAIERGLATACWRGRLERIDLAGGRSALVDAAHNPAGAETLAAYLREVAPQGLPLVFGAVRDKDHRGMFAHLLPAASCLVLTRPHSPRASDPEDLRRVAAAIRPDLPVTIEPDPIAALDEGWAHGPHIVVAGSIFLLGTVLPALEIRAGRAHA